MTHELAARAAARAAKRAAFDALPAPERQATLDRIERLLQQQEWIFAKTMPENPHEYTRRRDWTNDEDFVWMVETIRLLGYRRRYNGRWYVCFDVGAHMYWTMGWPVPATIVLNRKERAK